MRTMRRVGAALLTALTISTPVFAQSSDHRVSLNAAIGPSFANLGTTFSTTAGVDYTLNDRATLVGEFGVLPHAPFDKASTISPACDPGIRFAPGQRLPLERQPEGPSVQVRSV